MQRVATLAGHAFPRAGLQVDGALIVSATVLTAVAAQLAFPLPWTPVPITGQTFAVLLSGALLGARRGFAAQFLYLLAGVAGLPVFAGGAFGPIALLGPTGGYLIALPLAAGLTGWLAERGWDRRVGTMFLAMLLGNAVLYAFGLALLARFVPGPGLLAAGLLPFVPGDLIKAALAALVLPGAWRRLSA